VTSADLRIVIFIVNRGGVVRPLYELVADHAGRQKGRYVAGTGQEVIAMLWCPDILENTEY
jgi:hypothetical protein